MYCSKKQLCTIFDISRTTAWRIVKELESEIGVRYNKYAIIDNRVNAAVFADYYKYRKFLQDNRLRGSVPPFDVNEAETYIDKDEFNREW